MTPILQTSTFDDTFGTLPVSKTSGGKYQYVPAPGDVKSIPSSFIESSRMILLKPKSVILISKYFRPVPIKMLPVFCVADQKTLRFLFSQLFQNQNVENFQIEVFRQPQQQRSARSATQTKKKDIILHRHGKNHVNSTFPYLASNRNV